jgi:hypothetical protein
MPIPHGRLVNRSDAIELHPGLFEVGRDTRGRPMWMADAGKG